MKLKRAGQTATQTGNIERKLEERINKTKITMTETETELKRE